MLKGLQYYHLGGRVFQFCVLKTINAAKPKGKLSLVATPIGNLNDLTPNILKTLFKADLIGCQDRRVAGQLYTLIRNKNMVEKVQSVFGSIGVSSIVPYNEQIQTQSIEEEEKMKQHQFYEYSHMTDKQRRKFLGKMSREQQKEFKIEYLKYRAKKIVDKNQQFAFKQSHDKFDELYGLEVSDFKHIESQIINTRAKKGRGLLIPLNTYSQTKMFDLVRNLLQLKHVAIVSDAGMPCISDPGWKMIKMLRQAMSEVEIQVIGGPSAVDSMLTLATVAQKNNSLSGRFEGFAAPEVSNMTEESIELNQNLKLSKEKDFSIHFINSRKLKKKIFSMEKIYGGNHRIIVANQLTKNFERRFNGNLKQLTNQISKGEKQFQGIGEMSYLLYSKQQKKAEQPGPSESEKQKEKTEKLEQINRVETINIKKFVECLDASGVKMKSKQKEEILGAIFAVKGNRARKFIYEFQKNKNKL